MKYARFYWTMFTPMMKKIIRNRFDKELADKAVKQGKPEQTVAIHAVNRI